MGLAYLNLGLITLREGDPEGAGELFARSLILQRELGLGRGTARALVGLAGVAQGAGGPARAAWLLGAADSQLAAAAVPLPLADQAQYERTRTEARSALGEEGFEAARGEGRWMSLEEAPRYVLEGFLTQ